MKYFDDIYQEYIDLVYNLALQYVQNKDDAKEISQDVFLKIHKKLADFEGRSSLKTWIFRMTINTSLDHIKASKAIKRKANQHALDVSDPVVHNQIKDFNHPGVILEQKEAMKRIFDAMDQLKDNQRTIIILLKIEGLSQAEAAKVLDIGVKAVESLFQRAKKNLKKILDAKELSQ